MAALYPPNIQLTSNSAVELSCCVIDAEPVSSVNASAEPPDVLDTLI